MREGCSPSKMKKGAVGQNAGSVGKCDWGSYDVDCSGVPVFWTESGKALGDLRPVLAPNFVPTYVGSTAGFVNDDHADVKAIPRMCAQGLDDGCLRQGGIFEKDRQRV
jgi:hypothetical protein